MPQKHLQKYNQDPQQERKRDFDINVRLICNSSFVIYVLECNCGPQYVGRTSLNA